MGLWIQRYCFRLCRPLTLGCECVRRVGAGRGYRTCTTVVDKMALLMEKICRAKQKPERSEREHGGEKGPISQGPAGWLSSM